jgi:hypothetical protein
LAQNTKVLVFDFTEKHQFVAQTDRNSVFFGRKTQITDRLHIMIMYISFYGFFKIKFQLKIQRGYPSFLPKTHVCGKN